MVNDQVDRAFYNRAQDRIHLPPKEVFRHAAGYYGTAVHELAHWSGHPTRLNQSKRTDSYRFGDANHAREELRTEIASVFLAADRGIPHDPEQHAAYVDSWIQALQQDYHEIFRRHITFGHHGLSAGLERECSVDAERPAAPFAPAEIIAAEFPSREYGNCAT